MTMTPLLSLRALIVDEVQNNEVLRMLSSYIPNNTTLRVLDLSTESSIMYSLSSTLCVDFFNALRCSKYLKTIKVDNFITNDAVMASFSDWIASSQTLTTFKISRCRNITSVGWQSLATALASLENLEDISMQFHVADDEYDEDLLPDSDSGILLLKAFIFKPFI
jgi:hypothetical protein